MNGELGSPRWPRVVIGTAGWTVPAPMAAHVPATGSHLQRYATALPGAEINSSFHRPHADAVYTRWAASTRPHFRFAVKLPRAITHDQKLRRSRAPLAAFLAQSAGLGDKRGPLLVQLPPSHAFDARVAGRFFDVLRELYGGLVACEPRHATWFTPRAEDLLRRYHVGRVGADPAVAPSGHLPGGWSGLAYLRLHGSPRMYWSSYSHEALLAIAALLEHTSEGSDIWCMFDNTASGAAFGNAWDLQQHLRRTRR